MQVVEWRSVWIVYGVLCVMMVGTAVMPPQCADNWDTMAAVFHYESNTDITLMCLFFRESNPDKESVFW